jgi:hypothetical protein
MKSGGERKKQSPSQLRSAKMIKKNEKKEKIKIIKSRQCLGRRVVDFAAALYEDKK